MSRLAVIVLYGGMVLAATWFVAIHPIRTARRCQRLGVELATDRPSVGQESRLAQSDVRWYAEHCDQGRPRRD